MTGRCLKTGKKIVPAENLKYFHGIYSNLNLQKISNNLLKNHSGPI